MYSARTIARSAPRAVSRMSNLASAARPSTLLRTQCAPLRTQISAFSTTLLRSKPTGQISSELSEKLSSELKFESEMKESETLPVSIKDFTENGPFEVKDTPGSQDVVLTRTFGNEKITVTFSIGDLANMDESMFEEDSALGDEEGGPRDQDIEDVEDMENPTESNVPCRLSIVVEKPGAGALSIEATAQDASIIVENMSFFDDAAIAHSADAAAVHKARGVYPGPPFGTLDEDLQMLMEQYLDERGINSALAVFVPDYMEMKEQREYISWLKNVKKFVEV